MSRCADGGNIAKMAEMEIFSSESSYVTSFWRTKHSVTSRFAVGTLTDLLAKARLFDGDVNFISR